MRRLENTEAGMLGCLEAGKCLNSEIGMGNAEANKDEGGWEVEKLRRTEMVDDGRKEIVQRSEIGSRRSVTINNQCTFHKA